MSHPKIVVVEKDKRYLLRIHLSARNGGLIRFESNNEFSKREADYRAMMISSVYDFECDELPTHPLLEVYPANDKQEGK